MIFCNERRRSNLYSAFFLTVAIGNCMVKLIPPVNFCSDENMYSNHFWNKVGRFFKLSDRKQFNILNCRKSCEKNIFLRAGMIVRRAVARIASLWAQPALDHLHF
jgi:hypothetical protein